ncbi:MAG: Crp/Fnr family transcriptional regulator [Thiohalospira sp.]|uniref:Crp/Fnr family transcriptional regulator n=1 Tax=Thiohalospira sp. TaxID=3080549 RepID=UPI003980222D
MKEWEKRLLGAARELEAGERETLIGFAEYLGQRGEQEQRPAPEPLDIPRPEKETVVKAIRRLSATYPMLEKAKMLDETSSLMAEHTLQGRDADSVIDELETIFYRHYERHFGTTGEGGE